MKRKFLKLSIFFFLLCQSFSIQAQGTGSFETGAHSPVATRNLLTSVAYSPEVNANPFADVTNSDVSVQKLSSPIIYVNINGPDGDGSSWGTAFNNLQSALAQASNGDQIWVAQGTYIPSQGYSVATGVSLSTPRTETFKIPSGVQVYGGFNGTETSLGQRNFKTNLTILSGNLGDGTNAYHVVFFFRVGATDTLLDGFTISDGMANGSFPNNGGAGIFNNGNNNISNPVIRNCNFINNSATNGAAIYNNGLSSGNSSPSFENCVFSNNASTNQGGAVFNNGSSTGNSSPSFKNCVFSSNVSTNQGGAVYNNGTSAGNSSPSFVNCLFATNQATYGGAIFNNGEGGISLSSFTNVTFYNNSATTGRILRASANANTTITNAILWDTTTPSSLISSVAGAAVFISYSDITGGWVGDGNIDADPMFTNESNLIGADLIWATNDDGLTLQPGSPALATGTSTGAPTTDIIGNPQTTPASMGCYTEVLLPPTVTSINPPTGPDSGETVVTITGTNFTNATSVNFGVIPAMSITINSPTQITAVSPAGSGVVHVTVTTPIGTSVISPADQFTYISQPPNPTSNLVGKGTIAGSSGAIAFNVRATRNSRNQIVADMFYNDPGARVHFDNPVVTSLIFNGKQVTLGGTVNVRNRPVTFTAIVTGGSTGTLSVNLSNGYSASGNLTSGGITVQ